MRFRSKRHRGRQAVIPGVTLVAAAAGAALTGLARRRRHAREPEMWQCRCGQDFRVSGMGRHRVYWLADAPEDEPVMSQACPSCERPLPAGRRRRVVA